MTSMRSMLEHFNGGIVSLSEVAGGYRVSTRIDGHMFSILGVEEDFVALQSDTLRLRKLVSLSNVVELEIVLDLRDAEQADINGS